MTRLGGKPQGAGIPKLDRFDRRQWLEDDKSMSLGEPIYVELVVALAA
jgi:hypothetical protein